MKNFLWISLVIVAVGFAMPALAQESGRDLVEAGVAAYNSKDLAYFEERLADDVVWLDEDGHVLAGKSVVVGFLRQQFNATPSRTLSISNLRAGGTADAAWATFAYSLEGGDAHTAGLNTTVFKRVDNDWRIAVVHGAVNAEGH